MSYTFLKTSKPTPKLAAELWKSRIYDFIVVFTSQYLWSCYRDSQVTKAKKCTGSVI